MTAAQGLALMGAVFLAPAMPRGFNMAVSAILIGAALLVERGLL